MHGEFDLQLASLARAAGEFHASVVGFHPVPDVGEAYPGAQRLRVEALSIIPLGQRQDIVPVM